MVLHIAAIQLNDSPALRQHVTRCIGSALRAVRDRVSRVTVRLMDENGPRGGMDKRCCVEVRMGRGAPVLIEERDGDVYRAVKVASARVRRAVRRRASKRLRR